MKETVKITLRLPKEFIEEIDFLVAIDDFPSRSEAVRTAVRDLLYDRVDVVMDKTEKKLEMRRQIAQIEEIKNEYLRR